ncbi:MULTISPECIES: MFS transporter [Streptomyces]|uniref:MFS transporter n=2 Tax=Streptomyces TaxID=1883 RepID=A0ACC4W8K2_STRFR|nr:MULTISPECIES: MFS transporter [Streptomyces]KNE80873.1 MFS transporter [Streptomyces fradiae]OFA55943.1 MFS transporter [Streptomyces fradiae]PQM24968.1 MFS transporter [Streptomyces xinghaiensis]RKM99019.1 MFS transporter [Streptomyces xinghaiensis]RNC76077.1 MFS transporter [Streptomyces xinghaiensis]
MTRTNTSPPARTSARRVLLGSFVGTAVEWYDYFIYGMAAALVFGPQFFPQFSPAAGTLASFATYSVGFAARPLGGIVMGHFGDRIGRKSMLVLSLTVMGLATTGIGLLPTYDTIGVWAPVLLVTLRFVQGLGVGGEWGGAVLMAVEHAPAGRRGFYGSFPQMGVPGGLILANLVFLSVSQGLGTAAFTEWGWRIPFLASALLIVVGLVIRVGIQESPEFAAVKQDSTDERPARLPIVEVLRNQWRDVLLAGGTFIANNAIGYIFMAYTLAYGTKVLGLSRNTMLVVILIGAATWLVAIAGSAILSDRVGRRRVFVSGSVGLVAAAAVFFPLLDSASTPVLLLAFLLMAVMLGFTYGPQAALFSELFPAKLRYSGSSLGYQLGAILGGGIAPTVATALYGINNQSWPITVYLVLISSFSLVCVLVLTRRPREHAPITEPEPEQVSTLQG